MTTPHKEGPEYRPEEFLDINSDLHCHLAFENHWSLDLFI